jgi:cell division protease FtsH
MEMNSKNEDSKKTVDAQPSNAQRSNPNQMNPGSAGQNGSSVPNAPKGPNIFNVLMVVFLITFLINTFLVDRVRKSAQTIEYSQFIQLVESGNVNQVLLSDSLLRITIAADADLAEVEKILYPSGQGEERQPTPAAGASYITVRVDDPDLVNRLSSNAVAFSQIESNTNKSPLTNLISTWIIPTLIMYLFYSFVIRNVMKRMGQNQPGGRLGGIFGIGKSRATEYNLEKNINVTFKDVAGQDEAKEI